METKLQYSFKYFENSLPLFHVAEKEFPFSDHRKILQNKLADNPSQAFIDFQIDELKKSYADGIHSPWAIGYGHKMGDQDHPISIFAWDCYTLYKPIFFALAKLKGLSETKKNLEHSYLRELAAGVNDALLHERLLNLKENKKAIGKNLAKASSKKLSEIWNDNSFSQCVETLTLISKNNFKISNIISIKGKYIGGPKKGKAQVAAWIIACWKKGKFGTEKTSFMQMKLAAEQEFKGLSFDKAAHYFYQQNVQNLISAFADHII